MDCGQELPLGQCPQCGINKPRLFRMASFDSTNCEGNGRRYWTCYQCITCGGVVLAVAYENYGLLRDLWPSAPEVDADVPDRARTYLTQALGSLHAPAGAQM